MVGTWLSGNGCRPMRGCHNDKTSKRVGYWFIYFFLADYNRIWNCPHNIGNYRMLFIKRAWLEHELHFTHLLLSQTNHVVSLFIWCLCTNMCESRYEKMCLQVSFSYWLNVTSMCIYVYQSVSDLINVCLCECLLYAFFFMYSCSFVWRQTCMNIYWAGTVNGW